MDKKDCRVCGNKVQQFLSLGKMPLPNAFVTVDQLQDEEIIYPTDVCFCDSCGMVQLGIVVDPNEMFNRYAYITGSSQPSIIHLHEIADQVVKKCNIPVNSLVIDIGSNDGTLLEGFKKQGMRVLGVDPAQNIAAVANQKGIDTLSLYFNAENIEVIRSTKGSPSVITATNVVAHIDNLGELVESVSCLLKDDGVFVFEVPYLPRMIQHMEFDTIYHEHLSYFAVRPLIQLFKQYGMSIIDIEEQDVHGGTIRVYVKKGKLMPSIVVDWLVYIERHMGFDNRMVFDKFARDVEAVKIELVNLLGGLKKQNKRIVGYGAAAKGNILTNYCRIGKETLDYIGDNTEYKQGLYTPGMHIPVVSFDLFHSKPPDYTLLLAWNYAKSIIVKETKYKGKFILPIPTPEIL